MLLIILINKKTILSICFRIFVLEIEKHMIILSNLFFFFYFNLYIYPPDSQESDGGAIHRVSNYPDLLPEMPSYCCPLVI